MGSPNSRCPSQDLDSLRLDLLRTPLEPMGRSLKLWQLQILYRGSWAASTRTQERWTRSTLTHFSTSTNLVSCRTEESSYPVTYGSDRFGVFGPRHNLC